MLVRMGEYAVCRDEEAPAGLTIRGLGSCVAIFVCERQGRAGALAHVLLPEPADGSPLTAAGRFAPTALAAVLDGLFQLGCRRDELFAKVVGGAHMFTSAVSEVETLGERNIRAALQALERESIEVTAMDIGGSYGRTLHARIATGRILVTSLRREPREI